VLQIASQKALAMTTEKETNLPAMIGPGVAGGAICSAHNVIPGLLAP